MHFTSVRFSPTMIGSAFVLALWFAIVSCAATAHSEEWSIPVGGNAYRLSTEANERQVAIKRLYLGVTGTRFMLSTFMSIALAISSCKWKVGPIRVRLNSFSL